MTDRETPSLARRVAAEGVGTCFLLAAVVGSGIMAERLFPGSVGLALLANAIATGAALAALILTFGPISGAHFNPAVTFSSVFNRELSSTDLPFYLIAQLVGAVVGVILANLMFELPAISLSQHARHGFGQILSELVATFGLLTVILGSSRSRSSEVVAIAVAAYITAAYWFTASTSFANPAVTIARSLSDTFAGIAPADVAGFVGVQMLGAAAATLLFRWLISGIPVVTRIGE
ncbi:MAG TPA: MIP/aquaporin family protein [Candidatus Limnocylindrales bacterium]|nr:MIP/aquaporin family protein [Candidatus Limnocylindrales bacterium]